MFPIYLFSQFEDLQTAGTAGISTGMAGFIAPFSGCVTGISVSACDQAADGGGGLGNHRFRLSTETGESYDWAFDYTNPLAAPIVRGVPFHLESDPSMADSITGDSNQINFIHAGDGFMIESQGDGGASNWANIIVEFSPGS